MKKKLALLLAFSLLLSLLPASTVMAEEDEDNEYDYEVAYDYDPAEDEDYNDEYDDEDEDDYPPVPAVQPIVPITTTPAAVTLRFVIGETTFTRNDTSFTLDAAPFIDAAVGRTMVPLAAIGEGLGATVTWDGEARTVNVVRGDVDATISVDEDLPGGMGRPAIVADRTFVPLAYVANLLGAETQWDPDAQAVYVIY